MGISGRIQGGQAQPVGSLHAGVWSLRNKITHGGDRTSVEVFMKKLNTAIKLKASVELIKKQHSDHRKAITHELHRAVPISISCDVALRVEFSMAAVVAMNVLLKVVAACSERIEDVDVFCGELMAVKLPAEMENKHQWQDFENLSNSEQLVHTIKDPLKHG